MTNTAISQQAHNINWLLSSFSTQTDGVEQAIAVSSDGLLMAISSNLDRASADKIAAIVTGIRSLADGASRLLGKWHLHQVIIEMDASFLFVSAISGGATLGVVAARDCDLGLIGYETALLVQRVGGQLTPELIAELKTTLTGL